MATEDRVVRTPPTGPVIMGPRTGVGSAGHWEAPFVELEHGGTTATWFDWTEVWNTGGFEINFTEIVPAVSGIYHCVARAYVEIQQLNAGAHMDVDYFSFGLGEIRNQHLAASDVLVDVEKGFAHLNTSGLVPLAAGEAIAMRGRIGVTGGSVAGDYIRFYPRFSMMLVSRTYPL